jgi:subtilisin family serine protease
LQELAGLDRNAAIIAVALGNCHNLNVDVPGEIYAFPVVMGAIRPDLGYDEPAQPTMIGVAGIETWNDVMGEAWMFPPRASVSSRGRATGHIAAPAAGWRILTVGPAVPAGLVDDTTDCGDGPYPACAGTSFATPQVAGTAALVLAHEPLLDARTVRSRILDAAWTGDLAFVGVVEGDRVLDVAAAVGVPR